MTYEGPLPPASEFEHYERVCPGAADRILAMAEKEESHRHETEDRIVNSVIKQTKVGQVFAFSIALGSLGTVIASLIMDRPFGAIAPAILALTSLAAVFIGNKNNK
jgi:uncharacterized membrane protein